MRRIAPCPSRSTVGLLRAAGRLMVWLQRYETIERGLRGAAAGQSSNSRATQQGMSWS